MANLFLLAIIIIAVILLYKIAVSLYDYYITRRKLSHIPGPAAIPFIGTLEIVQQTEEGKMRKKMRILFVLLLLFAIYILFTNKCARGTQCTSYINKLLCRRSFGLVSVTIAQI